MHKTRSRIYLYAFLNLLVFLYCKHVFALYPQAYVPAPADKHFFLVYYDHINTDGQYSQSIIGFASRDKGAVRSWTGDIHWS